MNITGRFEVESYPPDNGDGALYKTRMNNENLILNPMGTGNSIGMFDMYLDASRTWTGIFFVV